MIFPNQLRYLGSAPKPQAWPMWRDLECPWRHGQSCGTHASCHRIGPGTQAGSHSSSALLLLRPVPLSVGHSFTEHAACRLPRWALGPQRQTRQTGPAFTEGASGQRSGGEPHHGIPQCKATDILRGQEGAHAGRLYVPKAGLDLLREAGVMPWGSDIWAEVWRMSGI